jgi:pimeloyl-ACP methyl ester carboxylesterase
MTHAPTRRTVIRSVGVVAAASQLPTRLTASSPVNPQGATLMTLTHVTAPTQFIEASGIRFAFRRFGKEDGTPLVLMQHFRGAMDNWDPTVTDGFAKDRPVILFNNAGVASTSGETPETINSMGDYAAAFVRALGLSKMDVLGFSLGGMVAQAFTIRNPQLARRLILVGTCPRGGEPTQDAGVAQHSRGNSTQEDFLYLFFAPSAGSQAAGRAFWARRHLRTHDVDPPCSAQTMKAQLAAYADWLQVRGERFAELRSINQPTLVVNGNRDVMIPTINSFNLAQHIPNAQLIIYPDSGHASHFQYPELFLSHARTFLDG